MQSQQYDLLEIEEKLFISKAVKYQSKTIVSDILHR